MAEAIVILGIASPFLLMIWLTLARRKAQARVSEQWSDPEPQAKFATEDMEVDGEGNRLIRPNYADSEFDEPDSTGGEHHGIRGLQGRR